MHRKTSLAALGLLCAVSAVTAAESGWTELPAALWTGSTKAEVPALKASYAAAVAYPKPSGVTCRSVEALPAGLYQVRLTLRPSHVADPIAFNSSLRVVVDSTRVAQFPGYFFGRVHHPETRTFQYVQPRTGPLTLVFQAATDPGLCEKTFVAAKLKSGGPSLAGGIEDDRRRAPGTDLDLELSLSPDKAAYYLVDKVEVRAITRSGRVTRVTRDKIRYRPGETLKGSATVMDVGGQGGDGTLNVYLEHGVRDRVKVRRLPVKLDNSPQVFPFEIALPDEEFGYAVVAEYVAADGRDRSEAAEYFNIASNFNRVYIGAEGSVGHGSTEVDEAAMRRKVDEVVAGYGNAVEHFAWAEEDMVEMSPETDFWFSGQTCYHMSKKGLQQAIRLAHGRGVAQVSYAKFTMSGYLGWKTAYDYPNDHRNQYFNPVGMWDSVNVPLLDRFRNKEFVVYEDTPRIGEHPFNASWRGFLPINPDATPRMVRIAAEEVIRSVEMFGWDGIRWDGHPRGGGQCGGEGAYNALAARRTQALIRYFKDIVSARYPGFGYGYNYLLIQEKPGYDWALEDYELDELSRAGGLLMNESIRNRTGGPFEYIARNLQVEGDLVRERGGYFMGIAGGLGIRDGLVEGALWAAAGARPYHEAIYEVKRYLTRYSQYSLDETLRRLDKPEHVLAPLAGTRLWWQPFVYETAAAGGKRQLVVNFLNLPLREMRTPKGSELHPACTLEPGTEPVAFSLSLPVGYRATGVNLVDPFTLAVTPVPLQDNRFDVPAVGIWLVGVVDLAVEAGVPSLASFYGPPKTLGAPRPARKAGVPSEVVLEPKKEVWEVNKDMAVLRGEPAGSKDPAADQAALDALPWDERNARLLAKRNQTQPENFLGGWWNGGTLPEDLKRKNKPLDFGNLAPRRNGRFDIYYGRGALDDRLRLASAFAGLNRFSVRDAPLAGRFGSGGGLWLVNGVGWQDYPGFDLLVYTAIPHCAMGVDNAYAMVEYVKAGGAVFVTGGEYAFGKGGYNWTVLDRELLPAQSVEGWDTRYSRDPLPIEAGKDFGELNVAADFGAKPSFWVWNQVALRDDPGLKVFLKAGNRPVLVGWTLGKGRVASLLLDHRGKSEKDVTAFFDWKDWPAVLRGVFAWLAPEALQNTPSPRRDLPQETTRSLLAELKGASIEDAIDRFDKAPVGEGLTALDGPKGEELRGAALESRVRVIQRLLDTSGPEVSASLAEQLAAVSNLPLETRFAIVDFIRRQPPANLADIGTRCLGAREGSIRGAGCQLLAMAGDPGFKKLFAGVSPGPAVPEDGRMELGRDLALGLLLYDKPDLKEEGRRRVGAWNAEEQKQKGRYTHGQEFSLAAPEVPLLDREILFQRVAWLAYLCRQEPKVFGAQFAREYLMTGQYEQYCDRSVENLAADQTLSAAGRSRQTAELVSLRTYLVRLRRLATPDMEALVKLQPDLAAAGFGSAHFTAEYLVAVNLLGAMDPTAAAGILDKLKEASNADLADFARARSAALPPTP